MKGTKFQQHFARAQALSHRTTGALAAARECRLPEQALEAGAALRLAGRYRERMETEIAAMLAAAPEAARSPARILQEATRVIWEAHRDLMALVSEHTLTGGPVGEEERKHLARLEARTALGAVEFLSQTQQVLDWDPEVRRSLGNAAAEILQETQDLGTEEECVAAIRRLVDRMEHPAESRKEGETLC